MNAFEFRGEWWLPENPKNSISGILKYDPVDGVTLELIGDFEKKGVRKDYYCIILGVLTNAKPVTLRNCYASKRNSSWAQHSFDTLSLIAEEIFIGRHFLSINEIVFSKLMIKYSYLTEWIGQNTFTVEVTPETSDCNVVYNKPEPIKAEIEGIEISLQQFFRRRSNLHEVILSQETFAIFHPESPKPFDYFLDQPFFHYRNFLSLALGNCVYPEQIVGIIAGEPNEVEIYSRFNRPLHIPKLGHPHDMLFAFKDISENYQKYLKLWFAKAEKLEPVYELYFSVTNNVSKYLNVQFLLLAQALEAYHRLAHGGEYLSPEEFEKVRKTLFESMPRELDTGFDEGLRSRIGFANEYSLQTRLKLILQSVLKPYDYEVGRLIGDCDSFVKHIKNTRNYLTHFSAKNKHVVTDIDELYGYIEKMKLLLQMCFLVEMEFPAEQVKRLIQQNRHFQYVSEK